VFWVEAGASETNKIEPIPLSPSVKQFGCFPVCWPHQLVLRECRMSTNISHLDESAKNESADNNSRLSSYYKSSALPLLVAANDNDFPDFPTDGAAALQLPWAIHESLRDIHKFVRFELPHLNRNAEKDIAELKTLINAVRALDFKKIRTALLLSLLTKADMIFALQLVGFVASSLERHGQINGNQPGYTLREISGFRALLFRLGKGTGLNPRDSHTTYWLLNPSHTLSFTGSPEEAYFNNAVNWTVVTLGRSLEVLEEFRLDSSKILTKEFVLVMNKVSNNFAYLRDSIFRGYFPCGPRPASMTVDFFLSRMRTYLVSYPVQTGRVLDAPNATYVGAYPSMDFALGCTHAEYQDTVEKRMRWMSDSERCSLEISIGMPSLYDSIKVALKGTEFTCPAEEELAGTVIEGYIDILKQWSKLSKVHIGLITRYVESPAKRMSRKEKTSKRTGFGVGGRPTSDTRKINEMRAQAVQLQKLLDMVPNSGSCSEDE